MPTPIYSYDDTTPAYHLRYTWTGWPTAGIAFPPQPSADFFETLDAAWKSDNLNRIATNWLSERIQFTFSTIPTASPVLFVSRVKGRLQHALRLHGSPVKFSRKVSFRAIGDNHTCDVETYIRSQVDKEQFVDPRYSEMLNRFTIPDPGVVLAEPSETNSGRYWYNLHVVLVVTSRARIHSENDFAKLDQCIQSTGRKNGYQLAVRAWMPDHLHVALRGNVEESPAEIALALMNNTAYAIGRNAIWQRGFYVGTFSEYDIRAVGG